MMTFENFFYLWWRNIEGTFWGNRLPPFENEASGFIYLAHILLLPLTLTLGAFLKTLFDALTRAPLPSTEKTILISTIEQMDVETLDKGCKDLIAVEEVTNCVGHTYNVPVHSASSSSSKKLLKDLKNLDDTTSTKLTNEIDRKNEELVIEQLSKPETPNPRKDYTQGYINTRVLNADNETLLETFTEKKRKDLSSEKAKYQRNYLTTYLRDEKNEGKALQHIIRDTFFNKNNLNNSASETATLMDSRLNSYS